MGDDSTEKANSDAIYEILSDPFRRYLCVYLVKSDSAVFTLEELAEQLEEWKCDQGDKSISRKRAAIRLHHLHLPKLANTGIITYDPEKYIVQYNENMETVLTEHLTDSMFSADSHLS